MHRFLLITLALACCAALPLRAEDAPKKLTPEERKTKFVALTKELEVMKPPDNASVEEQLAYCGQTIKLSTDFAKANPQTAEGFEAAFNAANQLAQRQHPQTGEMAQVAVDAAPAAGIDKGKLATCWVLVVYGKLIKNDIAAGRVALEKVKPLDADLYARAKQQLEAFEAQKKK